MLPEASRNKIKFTFELGTESSEKKAKKKYLTSYKSIYT